ncbi:MAG: hypothetical protein HZA51_11200 [Planctomycetes bacterium]|nr:hypothetical protein [Planctomycetota bacterium]
MRIRLLDGYACALILASAIRAETSVIVDHQPFNTGGGASDTLFATSLGQPIWQWHADDFVWATNEQLTRVNYWGFYNADNPPIHETFRLRLYLPRSSDGLPGQVIHEEVILNPNRTATGREIQVGITPNEYFFEAPLVAPVTLNANDRYWLEVVQVGDITTHFRWETSVSGNSQYAYDNPLGAGWRMAQGQGDHAFQLISPEPTSIILFGLALILKTRSRRTSRMIHDQSTTL